MAKLAGRSESAGLIECPVAARWPGPETEDGQGQREGEREGEGALRVYLAGRGGEGHQTAETLLQPAVAHRLGQRLTA